MTKLDLFFGLRGLTVIFACNPNPIKLTTNSYYSEVFEYVFDTIFLGHNNRQ